MSTTYALVLEKRMNDIASSIQTITRIRHGDKPTAEQVIKTGIDVVELMNKDMYRIVVGDRLTATREVLRRYGF